ncbi:MAG: glycosyltransferase family 2 protein [Bacillota bacterium]|nr:glycosyltransferase family 2 protein [Bacillota bacterium]
MFLIQILKAAIIVLNVLLFAYSLYSIGMTLFSFKKIKHKDYPEAARRFAFLIAARNEEAVIANLVESLMQQNYPRDLFDVIVIPNNCIDQTRAIAQQAGARILTCPGPVRSKGDVLNYALPELSRLESGYDAICVIDADNLVHPDFLLAMNQALLLGAKLAQGYRDSKNPADTGITGSYSIYFWLLNRFFNRARQNIGLSVPIGGSGFMISTELVRRMGALRLVTMTEDMELTILCHLAGEKGTWVPNAVVYDEQPLTFRQSWKQRSRWSSGMYQISALYTQPILKKALHDRRICGLDLIALYMTAHIQVMCFVSMLANSLLVLLQLLNHQTTPQSVWFATVTSFVSAWLIVTTIAVLTVLVEKKLHRGVWRGILTFWFFIMSWIPINIVCLFVRPTSWEQIRHERNIRYQDLS